MIALCVHWGGSFDPDMARRVVQSLEVGTKLTGKAHYLGPGILAATLNPAECVILPRGKTLLFHGFIQNRAVLKAWLGVNLASDAALYGAAWTAWGDDTDRRVIGEYAAIITDPAEPRAQLVRSAIQAPPLRYYQDRELLVVASIARTVFATGALRAEIDEQKIADSLYLNYADGARDWFKGLTRLEVGNRACISRSRSTTTRYYELGNLPAIRLKTDAEYVEAASVLLDQGTRSALEGRSQPAIALSGGLDSQAVAVHALNALSCGTSLLGLTGVPEDGWDWRVPPGTFGDEREHVAAIAAMYPALKTETVDAAGRSFDNRLGEMFLSAGGPPRNAMNLHWLHALHDRAREAGCDVLLTGALGNFSFSFDGTGALPAMLMAGRWGLLAREIRALRNNKSFARNLFIEAVRPNLSPTVSAQLHRLRSGGGFDCALPAWCPLDAQYARKMAVKVRADHYASAATTKTWRLSVMQGAAGEAGDINLAMEIVHGLPLRDPTAYRPLVEFCLGIPDEQFLKGGVKRRLAKRMLRGKIPDEVLDEHRTGLQCADWHVRLGRDRASLQTEVERLGDDPAMAQRFNVPHLREALAAWPNCTPEGTQREILQLALPRALATSRFIRFVEGTNS